MKTHHPEDCCQGEEHEICEECAEWLESHGKESIADALRRGME